MALTPQTRTPTSADKTNPTSVRKDKQDKNAHATTNVAKTDAQTGSVEDGYRSEFHAFQDYVEKHGGFEGLVGLFEGAGLGDTLRAWRKGQTSSSGDTLAGKYPSSTVTPAQLDRIFGRHRIAGFESFSLHRRRGPQFRGRLEAERGRDARLAHRHHERQHETATEQQRLQPPHEKRAKSRKTRFKSPLQKIREQRSHR
jgi:uncharacterized protein YidB (DUF937 family)